ncbi:hypothetical protein V8E36_008441, partial [Tilletia maclaganii]
YELYIEVTWPDSEPWVSQPEQLFEQLAGFLNDRLGTVTARAADAEYVKAVTLRHWKVALMTGVIERVEDQDQVRELLRGKRVARKDTLPDRLKQFSASLIETYNLDRQTQDRLFYGRSELNMLLLALDERARRTPPPPLNYAATLQLRLQLLVFFFTAIRLSSLAQHKANSGFLQVRDIRVLQVARFQYGIEIKVRNIERFNTALSLGMNQTWVLQPTTKASPLILSMLCI